MGCRYPELAESLVSLMVGLAPVSVATQIQGPARYIAPLGDQIERMMSLTGNQEFIMEVTEKTRADVKGGTLIQYGGKLRLLEVAQVPKDKLDDFMSVKKFNVFNTNNLWISLPAIQRVVRENKLEMEIIVNPVTLNTEGNPQLVQLVTAIGAAMKCFDNAVGLEVPRSRFLPVKKTSDLLLLRSNLYSHHHGNLVMSAKVCNTQII